MATLKRIWFDLNPQEKTAWQTFLRAADLTPDEHVDFTVGIFERMTYDGKIMAVPTNFAAACVYYNTEMFADAGVEVL